MRKHTRKKLNDLVEFIRESFKPEPVCDSYFRCSGWSRFVIKYGEYFEDIIRKWKYCPWCGRKVNR